MDSFNTQQQQQPKLKKKASKVKEESAPPREAVVITDGSEPPRTGRACLACRKLKVSRGHHLLDRTIKAAALSPLLFHQTRCEDSDNAPCKRCRLGGHECIFVESKRGKRPAR